jgi:hypothetical protein
MVDCSPTHVFNPLESNWLQRLQRRGDKLLSSVSLNFNLRPYTTGSLTIALLIFISTLGQGLTLDHFSAQAASTSQLKLNRF